jgi:hypothetical protein
MKHKHELWTIYFDGGGEIAQESCPIGRAANGEFVPNGHVCIDELRAVDARGNELRSRDQKPRASIGSPIVLFATVAPRIVWYFGHLTPEQ